MKKLVLALLLGVSVASMARIIEENKCYYEKDYQEQMRCYQELQLEQQRRMQQRQMRLYGY